MQVSSYCVYLWYCTVTYSCMVFAITCYLSNVLNALK